jgi:hypothetical protein
MTPGAVGQATGTPAERASRPPPRRRWQHLRLPGEIDEQREPLRLAAQHAPPLRRDPVVSPPRIGVRLAVDFLDPAIVTEALDRRVQRARLELDRAVGALEDVLDDRVSVLRSARKGEQDGVDDVGERSRVGDGQGGLQGFKL